VSGLEYALVVAFVGTAVASILASRRDLQTLRDYQAQVALTVANEGTPSQDDRRAAVRAIRRGKPMTDAETATAYLHEYDVIGKPPDYSRSSAIVTVAGAVSVSVLAGAAGRAAIAIAAAAVSLFVLALATRKWHLNRQIDRSMEATRRLHHGPPEPPG
jgi:hypothetical protein